VADTIELMPKFLPDMALGIGWRREFWVEALEERPLQATLPLGPQLADASPHMVELRLNVAREVFVGGEKSPVLGVADGEVPQRGVELGRSDAKELSHEPLVQPAKERERDLHGLLLALDVVGYLWDWLHGAL
jgi:hypothetical protein